MSKIRIYDVLIIGAGAAGYGTALTLSSVENRLDWIKNKKYLMIDDGKSDILKASFFNLAGVDFGIGGDQLLNKMQKQLDNFKSCERVNASVSAIQDLSDAYNVVTNISEYKAKIVVIATGMHKFDISCKDVTRAEHTDVLKPNKICLKHNDNKIKDGLYVAGLASGCKTMFAIANGDGVKVACSIFKSWTDKSMVAHDTISDARIMKN